MRGVHREVVLLCFLLLFVNKCLPTRAESENQLDLRASDDAGGGEVEHRQTVTTHEGEEDGLGSVEQKKEGQPVG